MAVRLRLTRMGRKNRPFYRVCAFDARTARDGRSIEILGHYDPLVEDSSKASSIQEDRVKYWLSVGAQPSETVASIIKRHGIEIPKPAKKKKKANAKAAEAKKPKAKKKK